MQRYQQIHISNLTGKWAVFDDQNNLGIITAIFEQDIPSNQWTLQHNMNTTNVFINIFKKNQFGKKEKINSIEKIELTNQNIITLFFSDMIVGFVEIIFYTPLNNMPIEIH